MKAQQIDPLESARAELRALRADDVRASELESQIAALSQQRLVSGWRERLQPANVACAAARAALEPLVARRDQAEKALKAAQAAVADQARRVADADAILSALMGECRDMLRAAGIEMDARSLLGPSDD